MIDSHEYFNELEIPPALQTRIEELLRTAEALLKEEIVDIFVEDNTAANNERIYPSVFAFTATYLANFEPLTGKSEMYVTKAAGGLGGLGLVSEGLVLGAAVRDSKDAGAVRFGKEPGRNAERHRFELQPAASDLERALPPPSFTR